MIGWLKKLFGPHLHRTSPVLVHRYEYPSKGYRGVADRVTYKGCRCWCGYEEAIQEVGRETINSLGMSPERWDQLKKNGWVPA